MVEIHYPHETEISMVYVACVAAMVRLADELIPAGRARDSFARAHLVLASFLGSLTDEQVDLWKRGVLKALLEMREEYDGDAGNSQSHPNGDTPRGEDRT